MGILLMCLQFLSFIFNSKQKSKLCWSTSTSSSVEPFLLSHLPWQEFQQLVENFQQRYALIEKSERFSNSFATSSSGSTEQIYSYDWNSVLLHSLYMEVLNLHPINWAIPSIQELEATDIFDSLLMAASGYKYFEICLYRLSIMMSLNSKS